MLSEAPGPICGKRQLLRLEAISHSACLAGRIEITRKQQQVEQVALFYENSLEKHILADHLLRLIDRFVDLDQVVRRGLGHSTAVSSGLRSIPS